MHIAIRESGGEPDPFFFYKIQMVLSSAGNILQYIHMLRKITMPFLWYIFHKISPPANRNSERNTISQNVNCCGTGGKIRLDVK